jgi:hypothetical protein
MIGAMLTSQEDSERLDSEGRPVCHRRVEEGRLDESVHDDRHAINQRGSKAEEQQPVTGQER